MSHINLLEQNQHLYPIMCKSPVVNSAHIMLVRKYPGHVNVS